MEDKAYQIKDSGKKMQVSKKPLFVLALMFFGFVFVVFLIQNKTPIAWIVNYEKGVELARKQKKPLLLVFYKPNAPMFVGAQNTTYNNPDVKKYVETNFIPVLINCTERPDLAKKFGVGYYPTHYVKNPDKEELFGPRLGGDVPNLFIKQMQQLLDKMNESLKE